MIICLYIYVAHQVCLWKFRTTKQISGQKLLNRLMDNLFLKKKSNHAKVPCSASGSGSATVPLSTVNSLAQLTEMGCCYKELWEILIRKQQHMENQQETELFRKCPEIH